MSKIGRKTIHIPDGVEVVSKDGMLLISGKLGELSQQILQYTSVDLKDKTIAVSSSDMKPQARANWGTMRALIQNMVIGVSEGYAKVLELEGIGFRATLDGKTLVLNIGFTHPVKFIPPQSVTITIEKNAIKITGIDKRIVGEVAATIRRFKKPEPYKGTGIRYRGEVVRRKAGKKVAGAAASA